jgi:hypothetical protein
MMLPSSCKAKGRALQNKIAEDLREAFRLSSSDIKPALMSEQGMDIKLSEAARMLFPFAVEAKANESLQFWAALKQCSDNAIEEGLMPLLVFKRNRSKIYACLEWDDLLEILEMAAISNNPGGKE